jgi:phage recombination protein Bet
METVQVYKTNELTNDDVKLLISSNIIPSGTPKDVIALFGKVCAEKQLSPFSKQIHLIPRAGKYTFQTSIDGYRSIAERTGVYAGNDDYLFNGTKTEFELIDNKILKPTTATATVYKIVGGLRCPFGATARWEEYYPGKSLGFMWDKMPFLMLGKCAEALALRKKKKLHSRSKRMWDT